MSARIRSRTHSNMIGYVALVFALVVAGALTGSLPATAAPPPPPSASAMQDWQNAGNPDAPCENVFIRYSWSDVRARADTAEVRLFQNGSATGHIISVSGQHVPGTGSISTNVFPLTASATTNDFRVEGRLLKNGRTVPGSLSVSTVESHPCSAGS